MPALSSDLRKTLENTVVKARELAERGARATLEELDVAANSHIASMTAEQERQRRRLRAHGRQLGDQVGSSKGSQSIERLVREMAYEHWHRMLFARFLVENKLLIEPSSGVAISLDECEELASEVRTDPWGLAAQFAQAMLPQIFRLDDPVLAVKLPLEIRQQLQGLVAGLETEIFIASDSLGWTYQFWQTAAKKAVNESGVKIGADELPAVTQLFTEVYMVDFLLDNTLGAWHAGKVLRSNPQLAETAASEADLRQAVALPGCPWTYLRFNHADKGPWAPAAGSFDGWPTTAAALKCLDPCMGSGHFVVAMFERLVALRMAEEDVNEQAAVAAVIEDNLFGLEIDPRCTQIAAFNLALAAWRRLDYCSLPAMNLACSGLAPNTSEAEWLALAGDDERLRNGMGRLYQLFEKAGVLGSLINPHADEADLLVAGFQELQPLLEQALAQESQDDIAHEMAVIARGVAKAAEILAENFTLIATNVPYLGSGKQVQALKEFCEKHHPTGKSDLASCILERCLAFSEKQGSTATVTPQNWMFLGSYKELRVRLLNGLSFNAIARLGTGAFESIAGWVVNISLSVVSKNKPSEGHVASWVDVSSRQSIPSKANSLIEDEIESFTQQSQLLNPDSRISFGSHCGEKQLSDYVVCHQGLATGDLPRFGAMFWELPELGNAWVPWQSTVSRTSHYGGKSLVLFWEGGEGQLHQFNEEHKAVRKNTHLRGIHAREKRGVLITQMASLPATIYTGEHYDDNTTVLLPHDEADLDGIWSFTSSKAYEEAVRAIDSSIKVPANTLAKVSFDINAWKAIAAENYPDGLPRPHSDDPDQWLFNGNPRSSIQPLQVAVGRLLGYKWPRQSGSSFFDCPALGPDGLEALVDDDGIV
jgi:hypothetical protein